MERPTRTSKVVIRTKHDNFVYLEANGEVLLDEEQPVEVAITVENEENILDTITIKNFIIKWIISVQITLTRQSLR
mgnify:CR=1 FL=1